MGAYTTLAVNEISIRAPTRGATNVRLSTFASSPYFNPRSHEGSDEEDK